MWDATVLQTNLKSRREIWPSSRDESDMNVKLVLRRQLETMHSVQRKLAINEMSTVTPATGWHFYAVLVTSSDIILVS